MLDPGISIRKSIFQTLDGHLTYNSAAVPVFTSKVEGATFPQLYVLINVTSMDDRSNQTRYVHDVTVSIDIINIRESTAQGSVMDNVSNQITQLVLPSTPSGNQLVLDAPFVLTKSWLGQANTDPVRQIDSNKFLHTKTINIINRITQ